MCYHMCAVHRPVPVGSVSFTAEWRETKNRVTQMISLKNEKKLRRHFSEKEWITFGSCERPTNTGTHKTNANCCSFLKGRRFDRAPIPVSSPQINTVHTGCEFSSRYRLWVFYGVILHNGAKPKHVRKITVLCCVRNACVLSWPLLYWCSSFLHRSLFYVQEFLYHLDACNLH